MYKLSFPPTPLLSLSSPRKGSVGSEQYFSRQFQLRGGSVARCVSMAAAAVAAAGETGGGGDEEEGSEAVPGGRERHGCKRYSPRGRRERRERKETKRENEVGREGEREEGMEEGERNREGEGEEGGMEEGSLGFPE